MTTTKATATDYADLTDDQRSRVRYVYAVRHAGETVTLGERVDEYNAIAAELFAPAADPFARINGGGADDLGVEHVTLTDTELATIEAEHLLPRVTLAEQCEVCGGHNTPGRYITGGCDDLDCDSHLS